MVLLYFTVLSLVFGGICCSVQDPVENSNEVQALLRKGIAVQKSSKSDGVKQQSGCSCVKASNECGCCAHLDIEKIGLNETGCVNLTYLPDQYGISLTFSLNNKIIFNETISASNPPPLCFGVPYLKDEASLCLLFHDLHVTNKTFSGCVDIEARLLHVFVEKVQLGCWHLPYHGKNVQNNEGGIRKPHMSALPLITVWRDLISKNHVLNSVDHSGCSCNDAKKECDCCAHIRIKKIKVDATACLGLQYIPKNVGIEVKLTWNNKVILHQTISARNPPSLCFKVPGLHHLGGLCLKFYNMDVNDKNLSGCALVEAKFMHATIAKIKVGCFKMKIGNSLNGLN